MLRSHFVFLIFKEIAIYVSVKFHLGAEMDGTETLVNLIIPDRLSSHCGWLCFPWQLTTVLLHPAAPSEALRPLRQASLTVQNPTKSEMLSTEHFTHPCTQKRLSVLQRPVVQL